jgi:crotonobetaine/carnitine-CoA ligase
MQELLEPIDVLSRYPAHRGTLNSILQSRAQSIPEREFLAFEQSSLSYAQVERLVGRAAAMFAARGVRPGERIGLMSRNHPSTAITLFALARLGAIAVPLNPDFLHAEAAYVLSHAQVSGVLCSPDCLTTVEQACGTLSTMPWLMLNEPGPAGRPTFDREIEAAPYVAPPDLGRPDSTCVFIYSSGTTGFPKGVMHAQRTLVLSGEGFVQRMYLQPDDRLMCIMPMFHVNAIFYSLCGALAAGASLILVPRFSASSFWRDVEETGATEVNTIAAISNILMRRPRSEWEPNHKLRSVYGGPFNAEVYRVFKDELGVPNVIEGYGMTEIPGVLSNPFLGPRKIGSMGIPSRHPDPDVRLAEVRIVDDEFREVESGQTGQLSVRTPLVMRGYYREPEQTRAAFRDGWFLTGDLAWRDDDGYSWFVARSKDIIRRRGENISAAEIDRIIGEHPDVLVAAAIPVPSPLGEDDILAAVVPREGAALTSHEIADWCRSRLARVKVPRYVAIVKSLPQNRSFRVEKFKLRADAAALVKMATDFSP